MISPTLLPGEFDYTSQGFFTLSNPCCCLGCPSGYMIGPSLSASYSADGGETTTTAGMVPMDIGGGYFGWATTPFEDVGNPGTFVFACVGSTACCDFQGHALGYLFSYGVCGEDPATPMSGFQVYEGECGSATPAGWSFTLTCPFTDNVQDTRVILDDQGNPWRCGCSKKIDTTFTAAHPTEHGQTIQVRITGDVCVVDPCSPPSDKTRHWYVLTRTYPYIETVAGGSELDLYDEAPADWISGPYFRSYVVDTPDNPETPEIDCTGHWVEVPEPEPYIPTWLVEYQDQDNEDNDIGLPYSGCHADGRETQIECRNWHYLKPKCDEHDPPQPQPEPSLIPITEDTDVDLDPARVEIGINPTATKRKRTFVDGPWPADSRWCCLTCPSPCARMSKADHTHRWEVNAWVDSDFGKMPGKETEYENEAYLICRLGWDFREYDVCRLNIFGEPPENCGEEDGPPYNGYSAGKKVQFHNILGGPKVVIKGDDETAESEGIFYPFALGEVNSDPGHWAVGTGSLGAPGDGPAWFPTRWWVLPGLADELDPDSLLAVQETSFIAVPGSWAAGPFNSADFTEEGRQAGEDAANAAAIPDGPWWCCRIQDVGSEGNIGEPYLGCVRQQDMPPPEVDPPAFPGDTTPPRFRIGKSIAGTALDPDHDYPEGVTSRTVTLADGPWVGAVGVGPSRLDRCRANCPPCSQLAGQNNDGDGGGMSMALRMARNVPSFWYVVLVDGGLKVEKSSSRPSDDVYVAGPFATEKKAGEYVG